MVPSIGDVLRQPEYTGENRCEPCTALNLGIAAVLGWLVSRRSKLAGLLTVLASTVLIYFRGYLVPGTPTLTKRYLPPAVLRLFGKDPEPDVASGLGSAPASPAGGRSADASDTEADVGTSPVAERDSDTESETVGAGEVTEAGTADETDENAEGGETDENVERSETGEFDLETHLLEHGLLEPREDSEDLRLTDDFESAWFDELEPLVDGADVDAEDAVDAFGYDDSREFELVKYNDGLLLRSGTTHIGTWPSRTALLADIATSRIVDSWLPDWETYGPERKGKILNGLRMFLDRCPGGGDVRTTEEAVQSCCRPHRVFAVVCEETGERLFEHAIKGTAP